MLICGLDYEVCGLRDMLVAVIREVRAEEALPKPTAPGEGVPAPLLHSSHHQTAGLINFHWVQCLGGRAKVGVRCHHSHRYGFYWHPCFQPAPVTVGSQPTVYCRVGSTGAFPECDGTPPVSFKTGEFQKRREMCHPPQVEYLLV